jgi:pantoate--beta-alanine ligase
MRIQLTADEGERDPGKLRAAGLEVIGEEPAARLDYLAIVNPDTLDPVGDVAGGALIAVAAHFGSTRLIDNIVLSVR